jgi:predicted dehydrogenase
VPGAHVLADALPGDQAAHDAFELLRLHEAAQAAIAVHFLDVCRWMLNLDYPLSVTSSGGKYRFPEDDQETPDTNIASFDFGSTTVTWEQRSWAPRTDQDSKADILFYGENGVLSITGNGYSIHDLKGNKVAERSADGGNLSHLQNLIDGIRDGTRLHAPIEDGAKSALLCHLGNIAWRTGHTIHADAKTGRIVSDKAALALWRRDYRKGWEPKV